MDKKAVISMPQLFCMMFLSRIAISVMYGGLVTDSSNMVDHILSAVFSFLLTFLLIIPLYRLYKINPKADLTDNLINIAGKLGYFLIIVYVFYYVLISSYTIANLSNFIANTMNPSVNSNVLAVTLVLIACYASYKGIEGIARASSVIFFMVILSFLFIVFSLISSVNMQNFRPFLYGGHKSMWEGTVYMLSHNFSIPLMAQLLPRAKGKAERGILFWNIGVYLFIFLGIFLLVGTMGDYIKTQLFPVYTVLNLAKVSELQHLEAIYLGVWITTVFVNISLFINVSSECVKKVFGRKAAKYSIPVFGIIILCWSAFASGREIWLGIFDVKFLFWFMIATSAAIPLVLIIIGFVVKKKGKKMI